MNSGARGAALAVLSAHEIVGRLEIEREKASAAGRSGLVAFDADGTLWEGDIGDATFEALLATRSVRAPAFAELQKLAVRVGAMVKSDPSEQASALYDAFLSGTLPPAEAYAMMAWAFAGHTADEMRAFAGRVIDAVDLAGRVFAEVRPILAWARAAGVPLYVVSASPL